jgi:hypothetical protein
VAHPDSPILIGISTAVMSIAYGFPTTVCLREGSKKLVSLISQILIVLEPVLRELYLTTRVKEPHSTS